MQYHKDSLDERSFVERVKSNLLDLIHKSQPAVRYGTSWFEWVELRNCIERIRQDYEQAVTLGLEWANIFDPSKLYSNWRELLQFVQDIDNIRFTFVKLCDEKLNYLNQLALAYQELDPIFSAQLQGAINNIEVERKSLTPMNHGRASVPRGDRGRGRRQLRERLRNWYYSSSRGYLTAIG